MKYSKLSGNDERQAIVKWLEERNAFNQIKEDWEEIKKEDGYERKTLLSNEETP